VRYRLSGGDCTTNKDYAPWATGTADKNGVAFLRGRSRLLSNRLDYYLFLEPWPHPLGHPDYSGLYGAWLVGQAFPLFAGQEPCL
jgi:hypothetical protein